MAPTRVLVLGIDGASPDLIRRWTRDGALPNLAALIERGRSTPTRGVDGFFIGSTWPSIHTGTTPARHGFHYQLQLTPGSYAFHRPADRGLFDCPPFWRALSEAGRRVAVLDAPLSALDDSLNGMQILEWGGHDALYGFRTHPSELAETIRSRFGDHPSGTTCDRTRRSAEEYGRFVDALAQGVEAKSRMTRHFLGEGGWDLFMQVFSEAHCVGHQCWHLHDPTHPGHDAAIRQRLGDPLERIYRSIDTAIGEVLEEAGECSVFVFSSHGMAHWYGAQFLLPEILFRLGVTCRSERPAARADATSLAVAAGTWAWHQLPPAARGRLRGLRDRYGPRPTRVASAQPMLDIDLARSRCFHHRHGLALGGIRLNLAGREPQGVIRPGKEADAFCRELAEDLLAIVDERTGAPLVRRVLRVAELYEGPRLAGLPDLVVDYDDTVATGSTQVHGGAGASVRVSSPKIGILEGANTFGRTGEHRPEGLLIAAGPGLSRGELARPVSVMDLAPTWTRTLGVELAQADGRPIEGLGAVA